MDELDDFTVKTMDESDRQGHGPVTGSGHRSRTEERTCTGVEGSLEEFGGVVGAYREVHERGIPCTVFRA
ncbi:hypothetical protein, partial [Streptomyces sp. gb14]|uniref:hypothetical protein n=1 Tax=Streptomyces sp. gb14 TaxID=1827753 RepID=UPI001C54CB20